MTHTHIYFFSTGLLFYLQLKLLTHQTVTFQFPLCGNDKENEIEKKKRRGSIKRDFEPYLLLTFSFCFVRLFDQRLHLLCKRTRQRRNNTRYTMPRGRKRENERESGSAGLFGLANLYSFVATWTLQLNNVFRQYRTLYKTKSKPAICLRPVVRPTTQQYWRKNGRDRDILKNNKETRFCIHFTK